MTFSVIERELTTDNLIRSYKQKFESYFHGFVSIAHSANVKRKPETKILPLPITRKPYLVM